MTKSISVEYDEDMGGSVIETGAAMRARNAQRWHEAIEGFTGWLRAANKAPRTVQLRRVQLTKLAVEIEFRTPPWKLTLDDIIVWMGQQEWSRETRYSYGCALRTFYAWGVKTGRTKRNPAIDLPHISRNQGLPRPTPDVIFGDALRNADDRTLLVLLLASMAGLRRFEIAGLRWDDIVGDHLRVRGKGDKERLIPMHADLKARLDAEHARRLDGRIGSGFRYCINADTWIFPGQRGGPVTPNVIGSIATKAMAGADWTTHTLRHRFGTRVLDATGDLAAVQELMGHASPQTTRVYTRVSQTRLTAAINAL